MPYLTEPEVNVDPTKLPDDVQSEFPYINKQLYEVLVNEPAIYEAMFETMAIRYGKERAQKFWDGDFDGGGFDEEKYHEYYIRQETILFAAIFSRLSAFYIGKVIHEYTNSP